RGTDTQHCPGSPDPRRPRLLTLPHRAPSPQMKPLTLILCVAALVLAACSHATDPKPSPTTTPAPAVTDFEAAWVEFWKVADGRATITMDSDSEANPHPMTIESGPEGFVATDGTSTVVFQPDVRPNAILVD